MNNLALIIEALRYLREDSLIIKRVKDRAEEIILLLQQDPESNFDKVLRTVEDLASSEIPSYDRTQLWDIISLLESQTVSP